MPNGGVSREEFNRLWAQVNGNGQPGMKQAIEEMAGTMAEIRGAQVERAKIDERRFKLQTLVLSAFGIIMAILALVETIHHARAGEYKFHKTLFDDPPAVYADSNSSPVETDSIRTTW